MLMLGAMLGLRREEISRVHTDNYLYSSNGLSLWVRGKGDRDRLLAVPDNLSALLLCHTQGFIFPGQIDGHLSPEYVGKLMSQAIPGRFSAHSLRHFFGTTAYGFTHDILLVQTMLGHSSPATTQIYVQLDTRGQRDTINQISDMLAA
jgi:integrase